MANVIVIGNGGREHALVWKLAKSKGVHQLFAAPGNPGTTLSRAHNLDIDISDHQALLEAVERYNIELTVIGPEAPLVNGLADFLRAHGHPVFGPGAEGAQIESSKSWAKKRMMLNKIPTAHAVICSSFEDAEARIYESSLPVVIKADGLAAGKGVYVCYSYQEAVEAARKLLEKPDSIILVEQHLIGPEASLFVITDGTTALPMLPARDYKRIGDGDTGANTGGMGAFCPIPDQSWVPEVMNEIVHPMLAVLRREEIVYRGLLYVGLILTDEGPKVCEFNCRFGDPETQVVLPLLKSDFYEFCRAAALGELESLGQLEWHSGACVGIVLASGGYPGKYEIGFPFIENYLVDSSHEVVFYAGVAYDHNELVTSGGRVLTAVARGAVMDVARMNAYQLVGRFDFSYMYYRTDIASTAS